MNCIAVLIVHGSARVAPEEMSQCIVCVVRCEERSWASNGLTMYVEEHSSAPCTCDLHSCNEPIPGTTKGKATEKSEQNGSERQDSTLIFF